VDLQRQDFSAEEALHKGLVSKLVGAAATAQGQANALGIAQKDSSVSVAVCR